MGTGDKPKTRGSQGGDGGQTQNKGCAQGGDRGKTQNKGGAQGGDGGQTQNKGGAKGRDGGNPNGSLQTTPTKKLKI